MLGEQLDPYIYSLASQINTFSYLHFLLHPHLLYPHLIGFSFLFTLRMNILDCF